MTDMSMTDSERAAYDAFSPETGMALHRAIHAIVMAEQDDACTVPAHIAQSLRDLAAQMPVSRVYGENTMSAAPISKIYVAWFSLCHEPTSSGRYEATSASDEAAYFCI